MESEYADLLLFRETSISKFERPDLYFAFLLKAKPGSQVKLDDDEINDFKWVPLKDLETFMNNHKVIGI